MEFYKRLIIKILESSQIGEDDDILKKLKNNIDLTQKEMRYLEELIDSII